MSDEEFNLCECIWKHELAMQRLLSMLRQTQGYCTDNECLSVSRIPGPQESTQSSEFLFTLFIIGMIVLLYAIRPKSLRSSRNDTNKTQDNEPDSSGDPPLPPPTVN